MKGHWNRGTARRLMVRPGNAIPHFSFFILNFSFSILHFGSHAMFTPDLHTRATQFFILTERASFLCYWSYRMFWNMFRSLVQDTAALLPSLATAVRENPDIHILLDLARHPLPDVLPQEALCWYESLVTAWEIHRTSRDPERRSSARLALVRLDGCGMPDGMRRPSRLPEWLAEARRMVRAGYEPVRTEPARTYKRLEALAALAAWRPAPGIVTSSRNLRNWVALWQQVRQSTDHLLKGIAAKAMLNLPEADLRAASIPPVPTGELLHELATAIRVTAERTDLNVKHNCLFLLDWQPMETTSLPVEGLVEIIRAWLEVTRHDAPQCRGTAWEQLIHWDQTGDLNVCGVDLLPHLVSGMKSEWSDHVLWKMSKWKPTVKTLTKGRNNADFALFRELEAQCRAQRQSERWLGAPSAWLLSLRLHQAGLASESSARFRRAYLSAAAEELNLHGLFAIAQWVPGLAPPPHRYLNWQEILQLRCQPEHQKWHNLEVARLSLLCQALEKGTGDALRRAALEAWRTGMEGAEEITSWLGPVVFRFHEVRAELAGGTVPDFERTPSSPAERHYPRLALPPGHIAGREWKMENGELKMENDGPELKPENRPAPDGPSR